MPKNNEEGGGGFLAVTVLSKTEGVALYIQVRETLREQIKQGLLEPGEKLPAEDETGSAIWSEPDDGATGYI